MKCPIAKAATLLGDLWIILIVRDLLKEPLRFNDLHKSLEGISTRTLTLKLNALEEQGIVKKKAYASPHCIKYAITPKGKRLSLITDAMAVYGKKYL